MAFDYNGNLFIADGSARVVREVDPATGYITTIAGNGMWDGNTGDGGPATSAELCFPEGLAFDNNNNLLYICDGEANDIRVVNLNYGTISTVAGDGNWGYVDGPASGAEFAWPDGIAVDPSGRYLFVADGCNNAVRMVDFNNGTVSTVATGSFTLNAPMGVACDPNGDY